MTFIITPLFAVSTYKTVSWRKNP